jgi:hypothetical protein
VNNCILVTCCHSCSRPRSRSRSSSILFCNFVIFKIIVQPHECGLYCQHIWQSVGDHFIANLSLPPRLTPIVMVPPHPKNHLLLF